VDVMAIRPISARALRTRCGPSQSCQSAASTPTSIVGKLRGSIAAVGTVLAFSMRDRQRKRSRDTITRHVGGKNMTSVAEHLPAGLVLEDVQQHWEEVDGLGRSAEEIASQCALLCCVQRQLGYFAALHEGAVGSGSVVNRAPPLPLVLTWEGPGGSDDVYAMSLAKSGSTTLLQQLLACVKQSEKDKRWGKPGASANRGLRAKVSLLRNFIDISDDPCNWTPGLHGLWYSCPLEDGRWATRVYLPEVAERIAGDSTIGEAAGRVVRALAAWDGNDARTAGEEDEVLEVSEETGAPEDVIGLSPDGEQHLAAGSLLYRFEALDGICPVANLPTMKSRTVSREHVQSLLVAQSRIQPGEGEGGGRSKARFAALTSASRAALPASDSGNGGGAALSSGKDAATPLSHGTASEELQVRAFIVPTSGAYSNAHLSFDDGILGPNATGLDQVRRIFVLASVWDCYIDGCGLPERRCAWYGNMPLDLVVLERLRSSRAFTELTVEQDMRERAIEVLLPLIHTCFTQRQDFTLVPVLVGGLMAPQAEQYSKLLAPYLADPANLFVVAGDVDELGEGLQSSRSNTPSGDAAEPASTDGVGPTSTVGSARRWIREVPALLGQKERIAPIFDALELFLAALAQAPQREQLSLNRFW